MILYHVYTFNLILKNTYIRNFEKKNYIFVSLFLFVITYYLICDPNPFLSFIFYHIFYPDFIKAVTIIIIHTYYLSFASAAQCKFFINSIEESNSKYELIKIFNKNTNSYFLSGLIKFVKIKKLGRISLIILFILYFFDIFLFENRITIWIYFNNKKKTLPISFSKNRVFYITSNVINIEPIIEVYIEEMKKLIDYLGYNNTIISIIENGDSVDNTRVYLKDFENYLNNKKILNKLVLTNEIEDIRKKVNPFIKGSRLRIEFYSKLRNKCFDYLYELPNIDFNNTIVIYFNDIIFKYEDIINLLSTNNEDFDSVCGLDIYSDYFYDRWVTIDLDGNGLKKYFPYFINKEAQDQILNHKPIRVFSCWNGVIAFKASPLKDKRLSFRYKRNYTLPKYLLNNPNNNYYESECTYFNIDLFSMGYVKKFINPDVKVWYNKKDYFNVKYYITTLKHIAFSFILYFIGFCQQRNKLMSNYVTEIINMNDILRNWYYENQILKN